MACCAPAHRPDIETRLYTPAHPVTQALPGRTTVLAVPMLALVRETPEEPYQRASIDEADALSDLGDEIATLAAHIHAATARFLALIADFDTRRGWELDGHRSCAHWLSFRTGFDLGACREKVRTARTLAALPKTSAAMARGELSFSAVRALTRVATPENEDDLLALATGCTIAQLERTVRGWKHVSRADEAEVERAQHESRSFTVFPGDDGMCVVKGRLPADVGALLMRALDAASDALYRENPSGAPGETDAERRRRAAQRRADAIALLAECALTTGLGGGAGHEDAGADSTTPISGTRAERHQVVLHVDADTLSSDREPGRSHLEDGTRVSAETSRRRSCDAGRVTMTHAPDGSILSVGRKTRTISPALRRALEFRDKGCRFPGCGQRFTDAHHVGTGRMEAKRHWGTVSWSAHTTTGYCMRVDGGWSGGATAARPLSTHGEACTSTGGGSHRLYPGSLTGLTPRSNP